MEQRCKACRHWGQFPGDSLCTHPKVQPSGAGAVPSDGIGSLTDECAFFTGPDFGCVHWEPKPDAEDA